MIRTRNGWQRRAWLRRRRGTTGVGIPTPGGADSPDSPDHYAHDSIVPAARRPSHPTLSTTHDPEFGSRCAGRRMVSVQTHSWEFDPNRASEKTGDGSGFTRDLRSRTAHRYPGQPLWPSLMLVLWQPHFVVDKLTPEHSRACGSICPAGLVLIASHREEAASPRRSSIDHLRLNRVRLFHHTQISKRAAQRREAACGHAYPENGRHISSHRHIANFANE